MTELLRRYRNENTSHAHDRAMRSKASLSQLVRCKGPRCELRPERTHLERLVSYALERTSASRSLFIFPVHLLLMFVEAPGIQLERLQRFGAMKTSSGSLLTQAILNADPDGVLMNNLSRTSPVAVCCRKATTTKCTVH